MIKVTEKAVKKLEELLANEKNAATKVLRISVGGFG
jgi:Fe-S cluster assembly iron-binding protein IscA